MSQEKPKKIFFIISLLLLCMAQSHAGIVMKTTWEGAWKDNNDGVIKIKEKNGFLDISGKDAVSLYTLVCLVDKNTAKCVGEGMTADKKDRFIYQSNLSIDTTGKLDETWTASFLGKELKGQTTFQRSDER